MFIKKEINKVALIGAFKEWGSFFILHTNKIFFGLRVKSEGAEPLLLFIFSLVSSYSVGLVKELKKERITITKLVYIA